MKHFSDALIEDITNEEAFTYYRCEVFDDNNTLRGGLFRGLKRLLDNLWEADDERYEYINEPLSYLEYKTPYPDGLDDAKIKFAYKHDFYSKHIEYFWDIEEELKKLGWSMSIIKIDKPEKIVYEDDVQIAYL